MPPQPMMAKFKVFMNWVDVPGISCSGSRINASALTENSRYLHGEGGRPRMDLREFESLLHSVSHETPQSLGWSVSAHDRPARCRSSRPAIGITCARLRIAWH